MVTTKARELFEIYKNPGQSDEEEISSFSEFMDELHKNCNPTKEEFLQLVGSGFFQPEEYYDYHFNNPLWKRVITGGRRLLS